MFMKIPTKFCIFILSAAVLVATPVHARIIYVDDDANGLNNGTSWFDAFNYLQDAVDFASSHSEVNEIQMAAGTYRPSKRTDLDDPRSATFQLIDGLAIYGGFPSKSDPNWSGGDPNLKNRDPNAHETILSGNGNRYHVVTGSGADETAVIDGFTITAGNARRELLYVTRCSGGGMYNVILDFCCAGFIW